MPEPTGLANASHHRAVTAKELAGPNIAFTCRASGPRKRVRAVQTGARLPPRPDIGYGGRMKKLLSLGAIALLASCGSATPNGVDLVVSGTITRAGLAVSGVHQVTLYHNVSPLSSASSAIDGSFEIRAEVDPTLCDDAFYVWAALDNEAGSAGLNGCGEHQVEIDIDMVFTPPCQRRCAP